MNDKLDNLLNLALSLNEEQRLKTMDLWEGYKKQTRTWTLVVRYAGNLERIMEQFQIQATFLFSNYAIVTIKEEDIDSFSEYDEIIYIEMPKRFYYEVVRAASSSCFLVPWDVGLYGKGVLIGIIDSGIDIFHPWFQTEDGESKVIALWDQRVEGTPPKGFHQGNIYAKEEINFALKNRKAIQSKDYSGHGTAVAGIVSKLAPESELVVVALGNQSKDIARTPDLMEGITFLIQEAIRLGRPIAINLSFGNNYGSHRGSSLLETYLNDVSNLWKNVIVVGSGNEGDRGGHKRIKWSLDESISKKEIEIEASVGEREGNLNIQIWKNASVPVEIELQDPTGHKVPITQVKGRQIIYENTYTLLIYNGSSKPYELDQELYLVLLPKDTYLMSGVWRIRMTPKEQKALQIDLWLPVQGSLNSSTFFFEPSSELTQTIPSTAQKVITVGAYDSTTNSYAAFSGRGNRNMEYYKPDLVAPGVGIVTAMVDGGTQTVSGTSMATPFVTAASALYMEWGIILKHDPFLYGQKLKARLQKDAKSLPGEQIPNNKVGWGRLCVAQNLTEL